MLLQAAASVRRAPRTTASAVAAVAFRDPAAVVAALWALAAVHASAPSAFRNVELLTVRETAAAVLAYARLKVSWPITAAAPIAAAWGPQELATSLWAAALLRGADALAPDVARRLARRWTAL